MKNIKYELFDLRLRVDALELLLISREETSRENLEIFRKEAQENYSKAQDEFRQKQWDKIKLGSVIGYELFPSASLIIEIMSISPEPFRFLAGKIVNKSGKSGYRVGEIFTINSPFKIELQSGFEPTEIISREE